MKYIRRSDRYVYIRFFSLEHINKDWKFFNYLNVEFKSEIFLKIISLLFNFYNLRMRGTILALRMITFNGWNIFSHIMFMRFDLIL